MSDEDEIILADLDDEELVQQMFDDLYDGLREEIEEGVNILIERDWAPYDILTKALVGGMTIVGADFRDGILFVPEVLLAANAMKGGMAILKPLLAETGAPRVGKMVIGTVKGDIHDIGKNLVSMMMEGAGFDALLASDAAGNDTALTYCASCHGATGDSKENGHIPRLDILDEGYMQDALTAYRTGARDSGFMAHAATQLPPDDLTRVNGIGPATVDRMRDQIKFEE